MFWEVWKKKFLHFIICSFLASFCNSNDYKYDNYNYDEYYDYNNQKPEDYTDDYSQDSNDYYDQNVLAPPNPPPPHLTPPPIPPPTLQKREVCAQLFDPPKCFRICHIYGKRKPM